MLGELKTLAEDQNPSSYAQIFRQVIQCRLKELGVEATNPAPDDSRRILTTQKILSVLNVQVGDIHIEKMDLDNESWQEKVISRLTEFFRRLVVPAYNIHDPYFA
jgi:hypothetical protein